MIFVLKGRRKRNELAASLVLDRRLSGRHVPLRKGRARRAADRPTLTRAQAWALWTANRQAMARGLRIDRKVML